ncbi:MAG: DUF5317 family protein [Candidatus Liptonbacteria bacterium]|nr:DUF5317 family protein [Candidatus Liptonbacteria bacterium]
MLVMLTVVSALILILGFRADPEELFPDPSRLKKAYLFSFAITGSVVALAICVAGVPDNPPAAAKFIAANFGASLLLVSVNKRYFALKFFIPLAALLNGAVIALNNWRMPVFTHGDFGLELAILGSPFHAVATENTKLPWLADYIESRFVFENASASIGDVVMLLAIIYTAVQLSINLQKKSLAYPRYL